MLGDGVPRLLLVSHEAAILQNNSGGIAIGHILWLWVQVDSLRAAINGRLEPAQAAAAAVLGQGLAQLQQVPEVYAIVSSCTGQVASQPDQVR